MNAKLRKLVQQLGEAIHETVSESEHIAGVVQDIRKQGFDVLLMLEATIGLNELEQQPEAMLEQMPSGVEVEDLHRRLAVLAVVVQILGDKLAPWKVDLRAISLRNDRHGAAAGAGVTGAHCPERDRHHDGRTVYLQADIICYRNGFAAG